MQPSRRRALGVLASTALVGIAGCASGSASDGPSADGTSTDAQPTDGTPAVSVEARLHGPEGDRHLFDEDDLEKIGPVDRMDGSYSIPTTLTDEATASVSEAVRAAGVDEDPGSFEIALGVDGEEVNRFGITGGLADAIAEGEWDGEFLLVFEDRDQAEAVSRALRGTGTERTGGNG